MQIQTLPKAWMVAAFGSLFAVSALSAFAQDTADLAVKGTIVPAACSASFTGGDTVDFGTIKVIDLPADDYHFLGEKTTALNVDCAAKKQVTFSITDSQAGTEITNAKMYTALGNATLSARHILGLGTVSVDSKAVNLGSYSISSSSREVDGQVGTNMHSSDEGLTWGSGTTFLTKDRVFSVGDGKVLATGKSFKFPLKINAALNLGSELQVAQDTRINGEAVFSIKYE
ncbi:DUF1120 domain-containing protein [Ralstonia sp. UBA689]|uniref:DUF1120 domain-containing protein n=1 Tax=Ralstonia sp. UBA689 TaxID=1947373 RepID=UPI0025D28EF5|nr:DUF1120 domain-containing protein [Ralstonia sp. UBA689]